MLEDADVDAAVAGGILSEAQGVALRELAKERARERAIALGHEERFRFMRGFNDIFFAIGVVLFVAGFSYLAGGTVPGLAVTAAVVWGLAELVVARLRLVLPGILLATLFVVLVFMAVPTERLLGIDFSLMRSLRSGEGLLGTLGSTPGAALAVGARALVAAAAAAAFYWRFRLPFVLLPLAASLVMFGLAAASKIVPAASLWDALVLLVAALAVFAAAMAFDTSDPARLTRRADSAFWLHLLAAPLIVHSLIWLISPWLSSATPAVPGPHWLGMTPALATGIVVIFAILAVIAIVIDRRALLVSGLTYLGAAIGYAITSTSVGSGGLSLAVAATLTALGALVLALGVGWLPLRRRIMPLLYAGLANHLPPVPVRP